MTDARFFSISSDSAQEPSGPVNKALLWIHSPETAAEMNDAGEGQGIKNNNKGLNKNAIRGASITNSV